MRPGGQGGDEVGEVDLRQGAGVAAQARLLDAGGEHGGQLVGRQRAEVELAAHGQTHGRLHGEGGGADAALGADEVAHRFAGSALLQQVERLAGGEALRLHFGCGGRQQFVAEVDLHVLLVHGVVEDDAELGLADLAVVDVECDAVVVAGLGVEVGRLERGADAVGLGDAQCYGDVAGPQVGGAGLTLGIVHVVAPLAVQLGAPVAEVALEGVGICDAHHGVLQRGGDGDVSGAIFLDFKSLRAGEVGALETLVVERAVECRHGVGAHLEPLVGGEEAGGGPGLGVGAVGLGQCQAELVDVGCIDGPFGAHSYGFLYLHGGGDGRRDASFSILEAPGVVVRTGAQKRQTDKKSPFWQQL